MTTDTHTKTAYQHLEKFCKIKSTSSYHASEIAITPRVTYLIEQLYLMEVNYKIDEFEIPNSTKGEKFVNLYVMFPSKNKDAKNIIFVAHHDVANPNSENCQDNSASVCNLLELCSTLKDKELQNNIIVCFTDGEEIVNANKCGAGRISRSIREGAKPFQNGVDYNINLELTGLGRNIWADRLNIEQSNSYDYLISKIDNVKEVRTPASDSVMFRANGFDSICIGCLDDENIKRDYPKTWMLCHSEQDTIDKISESDMNYFVHEILMKLV